MRLWAPDDGRTRRLLRQAPRWLALTFGLWVLYRYSFMAFGGLERFWLFARMNAHRYTSMAMLTGTLKLGNAVSRLGPDLQFYNGAVYTNWGYGVPLLQLPFHALAARLRGFSSGFFPDRPIFFAYFAVMVPVMWSGFDRLFAMKEPFSTWKLGRHFLSWAVTAFILGEVFFPLMSCRFLVYEEGICYFLLAELGALTAYIFAQRTRSTWIFVALGVAAGMGLLIRSTGAVYIGVWGLLLLLERPLRRRVLVYSLTLVPFVAFWMLTNWARTGSLVAMGMNNSMPYFDHHTPMVRFGSACIDSPRHAFQAAGRLFEGFFVRASIESPRWPWLDQCHFKFEQRPSAYGVHELPTAPGMYIGSFMTSPLVTLKPFFGPGVLVALVGMHLHLLLGRERRATFYVPLGAMVLMFAAFLLAFAEGFAWRYVGDFWPLIILAFVQYVRFLRPSQIRLFAIPLAVVLLYVARVDFWRDVMSDLTTIDTLEPTTAAAMWTDFGNSRYAMDKALPSRVHCGEMLAAAYHNGQGWRDGCKVGAFTNLFLGVPQKTEREYRLRLRTDGMYAESLRLYLNGRIYTAKAAGDGYVATVSLDYAALNQPVVMTTIEWPRGSEMSTGRLLSVELK